MRVTRRTFLKASAATGFVLAGPTCFTPEKIGLTDVFGSSVESSPPGGQSVTVISDVDAHSQCRMRPIVKEGKIIRIAGDPEDPEGKGELTLRGKHMREFLYAPDRLKHPLKRVGGRGEGRWRRISWDEALTTIADKFKGIKKADGPEAIHFLHGHYHSGDILGTYLPRLANV